MIGSEIGHEFVALVIAFPPIDDRVGEVAKVGRRELVIHGFGGYKKHENISRTTWLLQNAFSSSICKANRQPEPHLAPHGVFMVAIADVLRRSSVAQESVAY
jgi:hypothetical protein